MNQITSDDIRQCLAFAYMRGVRRYTSEGLLQRTIRGRLLILGFDAQTVDGFLAIAYSRESNEWYEHISDLEHYLSAMDIYNYKLNKE